MNSQWGWKDPRTCLFLASYRKLLPDAFYLNVIRDYRSTVSSLIRRDFAHYEKKYLARGSFQRFIWTNFKKVQRKRKFFRQLTVYYLRIWIAYNEEILKNMEVIPDNKYIVIDHQALQSHDKQIFDILVDSWGFQLKYTDFNQIFKSSMLNPADEIDSFVKDETLLEKAKTLEAKLQSLCI